MPLCSRSALAGFPSPGAWLPSVGPLPIPQGERDYPALPSLKGERGCFLLSLAGFYTGNRVYFTLPGISGGAFLMPCSLGRSLFFFSMCSVPGILGYRVAPGLLCGVAVPLCVTSSCLRCHSSIGNAYMHPRFSAIFSDFSRFSVHRQCLSHSISLFRIFLAFSYFCCWGTLWPVQGRGAGQDDRGGNGALCLCGPLCASLLRFWGRGAIPTFPPLPRRLGLPGASCVICGFSRLPAPVPPLACPTVPLRGLYWLLRFV